jgi:hypothetical protein
MDSNRCSCQHRDQADRVAALAADVDELAAEDRTGLTDGIRAERILALRRLLDRLEGHWLAELAEVDALGAAGADQGIPAAIREALALLAGGAYPFAELLTHAYPLERVAQPLAQAAGLTDPDDRLLKAVIRP